jgi:zinc transport system substrate-binding protein
MRYFAFIFCYMLSNNLLALENQKILASIRPLQSIVANLTKGVDEIGLIVDQNESLHNYHLAPKKTSSIHNSKMIILIDRKFETFLKNTLTNIDQKKTKVIEVAKLPHVKLLVDEEGHDHGHGHSHGHGHDEEHEHSHYYDYHIWLDPELVKNISKGLVDIFIKENPASALQYKNNLNEFIIKLDNLDKNILAKMEQVENNNFVVMHNAYQYFINRYNLEEPSAISIDHDYNIGAREFLKIQKSIKENKVKCIFEEPQFDSKIVKKIKGNSNVKVSKLDAEWGPENVSVEEQYITMMNELTTSFYNCLK